MYLNKVGEIGGAEISLQTLVGSLKKTEYRPVVVIGHDGPLSRRLKKMGIKVYVFPVDWCHFENPFPFIRTVSFLRRIIKKEKIKLIHSNTLWDNQYGVISSKLARIPHILHVRGFSNDQHTWKSFYQLGSMAICNSEYTRSQFVNSTGFKKRADVVFNGIDTKHFKPDQIKRADMRESCGLSDADFVMGMAGRLAEVKGQLPLLNALLPLLKKNKNCKILVAGDTKIHPETDYCERIKTFIHKNQLEGQVLLTGFIEDMTAFYNAIDLFLLPSIREPFGRVLIEAMAMEKPVIASMVDGVPEVVSTDSNCGFLVRPQEWDIWLSCIKRLIEDPRLAAHIGKEGRKRVEKCFSLEMQMGKIEKIYRSYFSEYG